MKINNINNKLNFRNQKRCQEMKNYKTKIQATKRNNYKNKIKLINLSTRVNRKVSKEK